MHRVHRQAIRADLRTELIHNAVVNPKPVRPALVYDLIHDSLLIFLPRISQIFTNCFCVIRGIRGKRLVVFFATNYLSVTN
jgi:hypothetical protein